MCQHWGKSLVESRVDVQPSLSEWALVEKAFKCGPLEQGHRGGDVWENSMGWIFESPDGWDGAVAEARLQVSKHSVELKVQSLKGAEKGCGLECSESPTYTDPEKIDKTIDFNFVLNLQSKHSEEDSFTRSLDWACLQGSWSVHPPCAEQRELPLYALEHAWQKPAVKAQNGAQTLGFPGPLLQI